MPAPEGPDSPSGAPKDNRNTPRRDRNVTAGKKTVIRPVKKAASTSSSTSSPAKSTASKTSPAKASHPKSAAAKSAAATSRASQGGRTSTTGSAKRDGKPARPDAARRTAPARRPAGNSARPAGPGQRPRRKGRSIVDQRRTPWGWIATAVALVVFAAGIVTYAVTRDSSSPSPASKGMSGNAQTRRYVQPEIAAAKAISGVRYRAQADHQHVTTTVDYNTSPPTGGNHSPLWADCSGTVYSTQIASENAVHMLEHGAVWITYNPDTISTADLGVLKKTVDGTDRLALSPYKGLTTPIALQAWNYQLGLNSATDPRLSRFIAALRYNPKTTPEPSATCSNPSFRSDQSTPGKPFNG